MRRNHHHAEIFDGIAMFAGCSRRQLAPLAKHADRVVLRAGTTIARPGQAARELVIVRGGTVEVNGRATWVAPHGPGLPIGLERVVEHQDFDAVVRAITELEVVVINGPAVRWAAQELRGVSDALRSLRAPVRLPLARAA